MLKRSLGLFSSFAAGLSYISILTGLFQMCYLGHQAGGVYFIFTWPFIFVGQLMMALMFSELSAEFPLEGGVFQWARKIGSENIALLVGVFYLGCLIVTLAAVPMALQMTLPQISTRFQLFGPHFTHNAIGFGIILIIVSTVVNAYGIRLLAFLNNIGVVFELLGIIFLIGLFFTHAQRSFFQAVVEPVLHLSSANSGHRNWIWLTPFLTSASLTASYVLYGFDTAGTLAEETLDPRRKTPRAILMALIASGVGGLLILIGLLMVLQGHETHLLSEGEHGPSYVVKHLLGDSFGTLFLWVIILSISVCTMAVQTGASRLIYAMGRERSGKLARFFSHLNDEGVPINALLISGILAILLLLGNFDFSHVIESLGCVAVLWANVAYLIIAVLYFRRAYYARGSGNGIGYLEREKLFSVGRWRFLLASFNLIWATFMVLNVGWPRIEVYGAGFFRQYAAIIYSVILVLLTWFLMEKKEEELASSTSGLSSLGQ